MGIEPTTLSLRGNSSTIKLRIQILNQHVKELIFVSPPGLEPRMNIIPRIKSPVPYQFCYEELCLFSHRDSNPTPHFKRVVPTNQFAIGEYVKNKKVRTFYFKFGLFKDYIFFMKSTFHTIHTCKHTELGWFSKAKPFTNHDNIFTSICCHFFNLLFFNFYYIFIFLSRFLLFLLLYSTFFQKFVFFSVFFKVSVVFIYY